MAIYYKLLRDDDIIPSLKATLPGNQDQWQNQLQKCIPVGNNFPFSSPFSPFSSPFSPFSSPSSPLVFTLVDRSNENECFLVCNLSKIDVEKRNKILYALGVISSNVEQKNEAEITSLLSDFYIRDKKSILSISHKYINKNFPLTHSEELAYDSIFVRHPLVGYENMLVPLEKYYKFLSDQSFNEFLTILVKLGVRKIELINSENTLMQKALEAYIGYKSSIGNSSNISGGYKEISTSSGRAYWGMEFEGKHVAPDEISNNFLDDFPFHKNNGTLKAMIEGIKSGNRNKTYTVERSFTGTYGLDIKAATEILGFEAGFNFNYETYKDEKSTFNVLY